MTRLVLIALAVVALFWLLRGARTRAGRGGGPQPASPAAPAAPPTPDLIACARCGVLLPQSDTLEADGRRFCCEEHRRAGAR